MSDPQPVLTLDPSLDPKPLRAGLVWADGLAPVSSRDRPSPWLAELLGRVREAGEAWLPPERKSAVRAMLRHGNYKPAGRSKPSSEYLLGAALPGETPGGGLPPGDPFGAYPLVNGPVDANNAVSLCWGYPASIFDAAKSGTDLLLRRGLPGEAYVFNQGGQAIDLEDLLLVCRRTAEGGWEPCGNPVKDAMATKVFEGCRAIVAVVYAPAKDPRHDLEACCGRFAALLSEDCGASGVGWKIIE